GTIASIVQFNTRVAPPGTGFFYASIEADVLGLVLRSATGSRRLLACGFTRCRSRARILQRRSPGLRSVGATARHRRAMGRATAGTTAQARRCDHRETLGRAPGTRKSEPDVWLWLSGVDSAWATAEFRRSTDITASICASIQRPSCSWFKRRLTGTTSLCVAGHACSRAVYSRVATEVRR